VVPFLPNKYCIEAYIPGYYRGAEDCLLVSRFFDQKREEKPQAELTAFQELVTRVRENHTLRDTHSFPYRIRILNTKDADQITGIYRNVFKTYPFPIFEKTYILKNMKDHSVLYFGVFDHRNLVGISSAELDPENQNVEMTDFATLPEYRGQNMAFQLLKTMEKEMKRTNMNTLYTIARLKAPGMNKTFLKAGYKFSGTLVNNTNISGNIESMNVYYKHLL
jgi:beta-lysine N6-acetyltransferase